MTSKARIIGLSLAEQTHLLKIYPWQIACIDDPIEQLQLTAVMVIGSSIQYIQHQTDYVKRMAIINLPSAITYI